MVCINSLTETFYLSSQYTSTTPVRHSSLGPEKEPSFLDCFKSYYDRAAALSDHNSGLLQDLRSCRAILRVEFPVKVRKNENICYFVFKYIDIE